MFPRLESVDRLLLGLWKGFYYSEKKLSHFEVYSRSLCFESTEPCEGCSYYMVKLIKNKICIVSSGIHKCQKQDHNLSKGDFHITVVKPFIHALIKEMKGKFDISNLKVLPRCISEARSLWSHR